jgi:hypothetical protein
MKACKSVEGKHARMKVRTTILSYYYRIYSHLFFTLLGFLWSYWGIYSIFPSNQILFNNSLYYSPVIDVFAAQKMRKNKQHYEGNMALRMISILTH